ncbi:zinc-type alcohol dehydrogenase protein [Salmonella bongori]|nr:zinc-type alcohol dehydrogenase protein [Salmonella bongori]
MKIKAIGAYSATQPLEAMDINRREPGPHDVQIDIAYCGVCHSDIHQVRAEWAGTLYPCVPGHEIVGRVTATGTHVNAYQVGDLVGVGCIVDSCKQCEECQDGLENYCDQMIGTYNFPTPDAPGHTLGGYSQQIVVHERYVLRIRHPQEQLAAVAPLLCAGITTWSPLRHWQVGRERRSAL